MRLLINASLLTTTVALALAAQDGAIVYRFGKDTFAVEQFSRTATKFSSDYVSRQGTSVIRTQYEITLANGRPTAAVARRLGADGARIPNQPSEIRFTVRADSTIREVMFGSDSTQRRAFAGSAFPTMPGYAYYEVINAWGSPRRDSLATVGILGNNLGYAGLEKFSGDTLRQKIAVNAMLMRFDGQGRLQSVDGVFTTQKLFGTRVTGRVDIAALASTMKPSGVMSPRMNAYAGFQQGPIFINYGSPATRGRTVWGGLLVPFDSIWRAGANEATHLATSKTIQIGDMTLAPGLYTLWIQHTRTATTLIVNRQVGQWGAGPTVYNPANDVGRVAMELTNTPSHVEDYTITIRPLPQGRGAIDFAWGDKQATATFQLRQQ